MNFSEFRATKVRHDNVASVPAIAAWSDDTRPAFVYMGDLCIFIDANGTYTVQLYRDEYVSANLIELEARLYVWAVSECGDEMAITTRDEMIARINAGEEEALISELVKEAE